MYHGEAVVMSPAQRVEALASAMFDLVSPPAGGDARDNEEWK